MRRVPSNVFWHKVDAHRVQTGRDPDGRYWLSKDGRSWSFDSSHEREVWRYFNGV